MICSSCFNLDSTCPVCGHAEPRRQLDLHIKRHDLTKFGLKENPLRSSGLGNIVLCPWRGAMTFIFDPEDSSGPAADTGSATHMAVSQWHQNGHDPAASVAAMVAEGAKYPLANFDESTAMFLLYSRDPRNIKADIVGVEQKIEFSLPPSPDDHTGEPIVVQGKVDQIRRDTSGRLRVYDLKTSKLPGLELMHDHMLQIAAYVIGASRLYSEPVSPGALICPRHYRAGILPETSPAGIFFPYPWEFGDAKHILWGLRRIVAAVRAGEVWFKSGSHCRWCPAKSPDTCIPRLVSVTDPGTMRISLPLATRPVEVADVGPIDFSKAFEF